VPTARAIIMSSTGRRSGPRARWARTMACCSAVPIGTCPSMLAFPSCFAR
jgi:hypothetical protein